MGIFLYAPLLGLISDAVGMLVVFSTGYLPVGAVVITTLFAILTFLFKGSEVGVLALVLAAIMFDRHLSGLIRVAKGEEKRNAQYFKKRSSKT
jgi:glycerol-3-phosphate acyltransferase PlsY